MKSHCIAVCVFGALVTSAHSQETIAEPRSNVGKPQTVKEKASYGIGLRFGSNMRRQRIDVDAKLVARGIVDALTGSEPLLSKEEIQSAMQTFETELQAQMASRMKVQGEANMKEGQAFLEANKSRDGVQVLPSGLQYKVIKPGTERSPKVTDTVRVHYEGKLINGRVFDSSLKRGEPIEMPVKGFIKGWIEALQLMKVGAKWQLFIPADLAYEKSGSPPNIGPNATLLFELELMGIK